MKNAYKKIKSLALACIMLFSVMTAVLVLPNQNVRADSSASFGVTAPANGKDYNVSTTTSINITWGTGTNLTKYNLTINGVLKQNNTKRYYNWDDFSTVTSGAYLIKVFAYNATLTPTKKYANNNRTVYINNPPGVSTWGNATTDLVFGVSYSSVSIDSSKWTGTAPFYLYYPTYRSGGAGVNANTFTWDGPIPVGGGSARVETKGTSAILETGGASFTFNRSGMWIFDADGIHAGNDPTSYAGYIWVNTSTNYSIESVSDFNYGDAGYKTITVNTGSDGGCNIAVINPDNSTTYHKYRATGVSDAIKIEAANFSMAGEYTVKAYRDAPPGVGVKDAQNDTYPYYDEDVDNNGVKDCYSGLYGSCYSGDFPTHPSTESENYNYSLVGPWDPPEKNATEITFTVDTGEPIITLTNTSNIYWGFQTRIDINVTDSAGKGIMPYHTAWANQVIKLKHGTTYYHDAFINNTHVKEGQQPGNYSILIPRQGTAGYGWTNLTDWVSSSFTVPGNNTNGTWRVVFGYDSNADSTYEWNNSASFTVKSANAPVQLVIVDDGSGKGTDKKVNVPTYTPASGTAATIDIVFDIFGRSIIDNESRAYYGDRADELAGALDNITIEGDILYPIDATTLVHGTLGRWTATVTPTKPGGTITLTIDWPGAHNGTATQTIDIVNGTYVTSAVDSFTVGADYNLTITVKDMDNAPVKNAYVYLMWADTSSEFNDTHGLPSQAGNGLNGEYTFWIPPHKKQPTTPDTAPQNITIAAKWDTGFWGYTKVVMARNHNMQVNLTPTTTYAGDFTTYDIMVDLVGGGHPAKTDLTVALYNSTGALVTGEDAWSKLATYDMTGTNHIEDIILSGGTYHLYAYNNTHDSQGQNATLIVTPYIVTSSPSVLAWKIDGAVNMTFQVTPAGNGTLTLKNMSSSAICSDVGETTTVDIENGVGTLDEVNATTLGNVTFEFTPQNEDGVVGEIRAADGLLRVTTATATPSPATIYVGEATSVTITITHPSTGAVLSGVEVGLDIDLNATATILSKLPSTAFTDAAGKVTFAITAEASGNVTIFIENETDPDNEFVIIAEARKTMTLSTDASVDEGKTFIVQAKDTSGVLITDATVTFTFAGQTWPTTTGSATITAPAVATSLTYTVTATAEGYNSPSTTIMVINIPKLMVIPAAEVFGNQKFTITIANIDNGVGVAGATVAFNGATYKSGANGVCELTAPDVKDKAGQDFPITASFPGFTDAAAEIQHIKQTKGVPGFELLTLVAAIGVAFLLLRRRRN